MSPRDLSNARRGWWQAIERSTDPTTARGRLVRRGAFAHAAAAERGALLEPGDGAPSGAATAARALCADVARHAGELARVADGGAVTGDSIAAAASIAADALELLTAAPLRPWWRGYAAGLSDAVDGLCDLTGAAWGGTAAAGIGPATRPNRAPLDVGRVAHDAASALAVGILATSDGIAAGPLDAAAPAVAALLTALTDRATAGDDAALELHVYLTAEGAQ